MSDIKRCDICRKVIKLGENISISSWVTKIKHDDICPKCWSNPEKWKEIHAVKDPKSKT